MRASQKGHTTVVQLLVDAKADLNVQDNVRFVFHSFSASHKLHHNLATVLPRILQCNGGMTHIHMSMIGQ